jgi:hypothetical protein
LVVEGQAGVVQEHLVIKHGIPSVDLHWKVKGYYSHEGHHHKQQGVRSGAVGDLVAVTMAMSRPHDLGAHLGHGAPDNSGHQRAAADSSIPALTCANPWDQAHQGGPS